MDYRFWSWTTGLPRWPPLLLLWRFENLLCSKVIISNFWLVVYIFLLVRFLEHLFSVSHIDFEVLWGRKRRCDALKAGVKASLFLCVNCIFKNAWMSADIGKSACRSCGIHGESPWRVIPSGGCSFPACLPDDIISVWQQRGVKATAGPQAPPTRHFIITPPAQAWQAQRICCLHTTIMTLSYNYSTIHKDRNVCIAYLGFRVV